MTALAVNKLVDHKESFNSYPVVAADIIYQGALVAVNAAGYLAPCAAEAGSMFAGVAYEKIDNSLGAAGALKCRVLSEGVFYFPVSGFAQTDLGEKVYASDDNTLTKTYAANLQLVGTVVDFVSSTKVGVKLLTSAGNGVAAIADQGAFTDPPSAAEMASLRTKVNSILAALRGEKIVQG